MDTAIKTGWVQQKTMLHPLSALSIYIDFSKKIVQPVKILRFVIRMHSIFI